MSIQQTGGLRGPENQAGREGDVLDQYGESGWDATIKRFHGDACTCCAAYPHDPTRPIAYLPGWLTDAWASPRPRYAHVGPPTRATGNEPR
jgi:hypothetical protein